MNNPVGVVSCHVAAGSPRDVLLAAKAAGLTSVEWFETDTIHVRELDVAAEITALARELGITNTYHAPFDGPWDLAARPEAEAVRLIEDMIAAACRLDARLMTVHLGKLPVGAERAAALERTCRVIAAAVRPAEDGGLRISVENLPTRGDRQYLGDRASDFDVLFAIADSLAVGWNLDVGHANITGNLAELLARHSGRLTNSHFHDNDGLADSHRPLGQGTVDWPDLLARLAAAGYRGPINLEFPLASGEYPWAVSMIRSALA